MKGAYQTNHNFTPIEKLDDILLAFNNSTEASDNFEAIRGGITFNTTPKELVSMLNKLLRDGFIETEYITIKEPNGSVMITKTEMANFSITFDGRLFINKGGYKWAQTKEKVKVAANIINIVILCLAAVFAILYYGKEMTKESIKEQKQPINILIDKKLLKTDSI